MAPSYVVRALSPSEAADGARAWNDLADGTLDEPTISKIEAALRGSGAGDFAAFAVEADGELRGLATGRVSSHPLYGRRGEIEALMIDERLPDEAGDDLARTAIGWLRGRGVSSISHLRDPDASAAFWERLGFRPDLLRYTLAD
jgi:hypothetical protein